MPLFNERGQALYETAKAAGDRGLMRYLVRTAALKNMGDSRAGTVNQACPSCWRGFSRCTCWPRFEFDEADALRAHGFDALTNTLLYDSDYGNA